MIDVDDALCAADGWLRGRTSLANRPDVAVVLAAEVKRLRAIAADSERYDCPARVLERWLWGWRYGKT